MCLGIPMQIIAIDGLMARCSAMGITRDVNLYLLQQQSIKAGDYVIVHVGYAIQRLTADEGRQTLALIESGPGSGSVSTGL